MTTALPPAAPAPPVLRCPRCAVEMATYERSGIVVDQCRDCRGIFLDRGELERLVDIESGTGWTGPRMTVPPPVDPRLLDARYLDPRRADPRYEGPREAGHRHAPASREDGSAAYRPEWHAWDDDDRDDQRQDGRGAGPQKRPSIVGEVLEGLRD